jgi:hypothetical protein
MATPLKNLTGKSGLFVFFLLLLGAAGMWLLKSATPFGIGLAPDSSYYISGAYSILQGKQYTVAYFPPLYSAFLAGLGLLGFDPVRGARLINIILFGASGTIIAVFGRRMTNSAIAGLALEILFMISTPLFSVYSFALSDPLFLFLNLLTLFSFGLYLEKRSTYLLAVVSFLGCLACLTRLIGFTIFISLALVLLVMESGWHKRLTSEMVMAAGLLPVIAWMYRNKVVLGTATNHPFYWHPITWGKIPAGIGYFLEWLIPYPQIQSVMNKFPVLAVITIAFIILVTAGWLIYTSAKLLSSQRTPSRNVLFAYPASTYFLCYLWALLFTISFLDAQVNLNDRILSPAYATLLIMAMACGTWLWRHYRNTVKTMLIFGLFLFAFGTSTEFIVSFEKMSRRGQVYANQKWNTSPTMDAVRLLPDSVKIYTNHTHAIYFWADRSSFDLPSPTDPITTRPNSDYARQMETFYREIAEGRAVLVVFDLEHFFPVTKSITDPLPVADKFPDGVIYGNPSVQAIINP